MIDLSPIKDQIADRYLAVFGLGISGLSVIRACLAAEIKVLAWDENAERREDARQVGAEVVDLNTCKMGDIAFLILSPSIPLTHPKPHPIAQRFSEYAVPIIGDIALFQMAKPEAKIIGVTGTNGKSTTTALLHHILSENGLDAEMGGNIGIPVMDLPDMPDENNKAYYIFELSSYQLDLNPHFGPQIAVLLNISADHLERHGGITGYVASKSHIFDHAHDAVLATDDKYTQKIAKKFSGTYPSTYCHVVATRQICPSGISVNDQGILMDQTHSAPLPILDMKELKILSGRHNWQNVAAAYATCRLLHITANDIANCVKTFPGLAHRQEFVGTYQNVTYINDSKATNDDAAAVALNTYDNIYWVAGGQAKKGGFKACAEYIDNIHGGYAYGQDQDDIAAFLQSHDKPCQKFDTLVQATEKAHQDANQEMLKNQHSTATILLAPACASWDQFKNFEIRGDAFKTCVTKLISPSTKAEDTR